ncbi:MAG: class B sortase [Lachnospiraceae bacterium]|nr:class B sortase [Lachnospiraceae bacterium]
MKQKNHNGLPVVALVFFGTVFLVSGILLLVYYYQGLRAKQQTDDVREAYVKIVGEDRQTAEEVRKETTEDTYSKSLQAYNEMKSLNPDYLGWIRIPDTGIDNPIVQGADNDHYLNHTITGEKNSRGTIFADKICKAQSAVHILHGHHMKDGSMFHDLSKFKKKDFLADHKEFYIDFGYGEVTYHIFAVMDVDLTKEGFFNYVEESDYGDTEAYLDKVVKNAFWHEERESVPKNSHYVLLSTCDYGTEEQRLVVAGYRVDGEE